MIKKITTVCILVILAALIMVPATQAQSPSHGHTAAITAGSGGVNIVQGKITPSGMLFIILEQIPGQNAYGQIQATANDPNFEIMLYNPNVAQAVTLSIATWGGAEKRDTYQPNMGERYNQRTPEGNSNTTVFCLLHEQRGTNDNGD